MKILPSMILASGMLFTGMYAQADDMQKHPMNHDQMMKECMSRMKAKNDGATKDQMHAACLDEMKSAMGNDDMSKDEMDKPK